MRKKLVEETKRNQQIQDDLDKKRRRNDMDKEKKKERDLEKKEENKINDPVHLQQNVKNLPDAVKSLHPDCLEFCVPGDGACCLNCLAAWIYLDFTQGPQLGRDLNTHLAQYREYYKNKLVFPLTITVSGGVLKTFEKGRRTTSLII